MINKKTIIPLLSLTLILLFSNLASAVIFDIPAAREREWERFEAYKLDYIKFNDLEAFSGYVSERNLARNFGFYGPDYYYIPPDVLAAKYNPPLQGEFYYTDNRGYTSTLGSPSAVKYHGDVVNGRYSGYIPNDRNYDHPDAYYGAYGSRYPSYGGYGNYGYQTNSYPSYGSYGGFGGYGYGYQGYGYQNYNYHFKDFEEPAYYARVAEPLSGGFYIVGFY
ncbi:hypothetical protein KY348_07520 [Candidatus Woesearchaeota archaeon]|nr:hypothetical protein [Candidatus Woesearchaeota archaeon]